MMRLVPFVLLAMTAACQAQTGQSDSIGSKHSQASRDRGKTKSARATLDGQAISSGKSKIHLGLGPHLVAASAGNKQQECRFVVLDQGPDKFDLEIK